MENLFLPSAYDFQTPQPMSPTQSRALSRTDSTDSIDQHFDQYRAQSQLRYPDFSERPSKTPSPHKSVHYKKLRVVPKPKKEPLNLNVSGHSIVGSSIGHVRNQKFECYVDKSVVKTTLPMNWAAARERKARSPVKTPSRYETNEQARRTHMMTRWEFEIASKTLANMEAKRKQRRPQAGALTPKWAKGAPSMVTSPDPKRMKDPSPVISTTMQVNDFQVPSF